jgi:hypothetical protein
MSINTMDASNPLSPVPPFTIPNPNSPNFPAQQARIPQSFSSKDISSLTTANTLTRDPSSAESLRRDSVVLSPTGGTPGESWSGALGEGALSGSAPRFFPGVVSRRETLRQGSFSEKDPDNLSKAYLSQIDGKTQDGAIDEGA